MSEARLILTCGLPGAGKTTLAKRLAAERPAVPLSKDDWLWALGSSPWNTAFGDKVEGQLWGLAQEILPLGLSVVLDFGLWAKSERDDLRPPLAVLVSASNCTTSTYQSTNCGNAFTPETLNHPGTRSR